MEIVSYLMKVVVRFMKGSINWVMVKGKYWEEVGRQSFLAGQSCVF